MRKLILSLILLSLVLPSLAGAQTTWPLQFQAGSITEDSTKVTVTKPMFFNSGLTLSGGQLLLPDGTASAPSLAFSSDPSDGLYAASGSVRVTINGGLTHAFSTGGFTIYGSSAALSMNGDTYLTRGAANTLYQKNGANPQAYWLANTDDGAGNYEQATLAWASNEFRIGTVKGGTGSNRAVRISSATGTVWTSALAPVTADSDTLGRSDSLYGHAYLSRSIQGSKTKALTETVATPLVQIAVPVGGYLAGTITVDVNCSDGTDWAGYGSRVVIRCHNKAGTETCGLNSGDTLASSGTGGASISSYTIASDNSPTNAVNITANVTCSLTQNVLDAYWRLDLLTPQTVTPQ